MIGMHRTYDKRHNGKSIVFCTTHLICIARIKSSDRMMIQVDTSDNPHE